MNLITSKSEGEFMQTYAAVWVSSPSDLSSGKLGSVIFLFCEYKLDALAVFWKSCSKLLFWVPFGTEKLCVPNRSCTLIPSWLPGEALLKMLVILLGNQGLGTTGSPQKGFSFFYADEQLVTLTYLYLSCFSLGCTEYFKHVTIYVRLSQSPV